MLSTQPSALQFALAGNLSEEVGKLQDADPVVGLQSEQMAIAGDDDLRLGFLGPSAGNGERGNEDIGVKNDPHDQRFW